jgi:hypothetical protein
VPNIAFGDAYNEIWIDPMGAFVVCPVDRKKFHDGLLGFGPIDIISFNA